MAVLRRAPGAPPRATLVVVLLVATLALAALLAYEAHDAVRAHRATAERAVRDYATLTAWERLATLAQTVDSTFAAAVRPATATRAASPWEEVPPPALLATSAQAIPGCPDGTAAPALFRVLLKDSSLALATPAGAAIPPGGAPRAARWLSDTVVAHARATYQAGARYALVLGAGAGEGLAVLYGVRDAQFGAPIAVYGIVTCRAALGAPFFAPLLHQGAPPRTVVDAGAPAEPPLPDDSLITLTVRAASGAPLWRSMPDEQPPTTGIVTTRVAGLVLEGALRPAALLRLAPPPAPDTRLPLLAGLLALTALLALAALLLLRREQELARLRADFTSSVSHELRTPLAQILLFGETLSMDRVRSDAERRLAVETIVQETKRLIHMVENVLHFARAERGIERLELRAAPLAPIVRDAVRAFAPLAESASATLELEVDDDVHAMADAAALRQVVLNLVDNAVKYGPAGQTVVVRVRRAGSRALVEVEDQGAGVPHVERERIWNAFVRVPREGARGGGGSGIGLAVVREIVALHEGEVRVEEAPGGGARFVVSLALEPVSGERWAVSGSTAPEPAEATPSVSRS